MQLIMMVLISCANVPVASAMNGPDPEKLNIETFDILGRKLLLPLPGSRATKDLEGVRTPILDRVDMESLRSSPVKLVSDMWDWRSLLHLYGSIGIKLYVESVAEGFDLTCRGALKESLRAKFASSGQGKLPAFHAVPEIADERAVSYRWGAVRGGKIGENDEESFAIALSRREYLTLRMNYYGGGDPAVKPADWLPKAESVKHAILSGMRFEGDWPILHDCGSPDIAKP
jgi:hypothetical protein